MFCRGRKQDHKNYKVSPGEWNKPSIYKTKIAEGVSNCLIPDKSSSLKGEAKKVENAIGRSKGIRINLLTMQLILLTHAF